jgi:hypothetical protein
VLLGLLFSTVTVWVVLDNVATLIGNVPSVQFALSGAAGSPIQYFISGREGSMHAPDKPGQLRYHGIFYVHDWKWILSTDKMDGFVAFACYMRCIALHAYPHTLPKLASHEIHFQNEFVANVQLTVGRCFSTTVLG